MVTERDDSHRKTIVLLKRNVNFWLTGTVHHLVNIIEEGIRIMLQTHHSSHHLENTKLQTRTENSCHVLLVYYIFNGSQSERKLL